MGHCADWKLMPYPYKGTEAQLEHYWKEHKRWRKDYNTCSECGSDKIEVRNHSAMWGDGDVYCVNNHYVRAWDSG